MSEFGEILDVALHLKYVEGHEVLMYITDGDHKKIGDGLVEKEDNWLRRLGQGYIWIVDGCTYGDRQDWLREKGEAVFGSSAKAAKLEEDRQIGQAFFRRLGLKQPESHNFKRIEDALKFVLENKEKKFILKQNGNAPKHLNHKTKFDGGVDMIYHLQKLQKSWNTSEWGEFDCDLMEQVEGMEVAVSAFFDGQNFVKGKDGKTVAFLNFEFKKESEGDNGETTGETGTVFVSANSDHKLVKLLIENPVTIDILRKTKFRGVFDINGCLTKEGYVGFEPTSRPGVPSSSYEFLSSGLVSTAAQMFETVSKGTGKPIELYQGTGIVVVVTAKPYPVEADLDKEATSIGEKLWILNGKNIQKEFTPEQRKHIHLENFYKDGSDYLIATKNGYLLTVTMRGKNVADAREKCLAYIKDNIYISGMKWRTDIGKKLEEQGF